MRIKLLWASIAVAVALVIGFIGGVFVRPGNNGVVTTNYVQGTNTVQYIHDFTAATNVNSYPQVFADYTNFHSAPFRFVQQNDLMTVTLWTRSASSRIKNWQRTDGVIAGGGWNLTGYPVALVGYHWANLTALITVGVTTNLNIALLGAWQF